MASDSSPGRVGSPPDFAFAFNDKNFSDRILRIEIVSDNFGTENVAEDEFDAVDEVGGHRKRRREEIKNDQGKKINPQFQIYVCIKALILLCLIYKALIIMCY